MIWYRETFPIVFIGLEGFVFWGFFCCWWCCGFFFEGSSLLFWKSLGITEPRRQDCLHQALSYFSLGLLILSLQDVYSCSHTPCKQEMVEWSQDSYWNTSLALALRLFRTLGIFTNRSNISVEVIRHAFLSLPRCLAFCSGRSKPGL